MQPLNETLLEKWEAIISEVNKSNVPLPCIKKIIFKLNSGSPKSKTINVQRLRQQGLDLEDIETVITRFLSENDDNIKDIEFIVDTISVAKIVQPETDRLLQGL
jgi:hypothetical protein